MKVLSALLWVMLGFTTMAPSFRARAEGKPVKPAGSAQRQNSVEEYSFSAEGKTGRVSVWPSATNSKAAGLMLFIHGSGGGDHYAATASVLAGVAREHNLILVAVQAPDHAVSWPNGNPAENNRHAQYLRSLIATRLASELKFDPARLYLVGLSAGSTFLAGDFLAEIGKDYRGALVLLCGGASPFFGIDRLAENARAGRFKIYVRIDTSDFLYAQTMQSVDFFKKTGFTVVTDISSEGRGHCAFDPAAVVSTALVRVGDKK